MKNERTGCNTTLLYEEDAYIKNFRANVLALEEGTDGILKLELSETVFFPEGGGQCGDQGVISGVRVIDVKREEGRVWHILKGDCVKRFTVGESVEGEVDFALRFKRMQNHIAEHLFCGIANKRFGYDNVGFHLSDVVTFDLDGPLSDKEIASIEDECNRAVWENVPVTVSFPTPQEAESMAFRSKLELSEGLRLVGIEGYDLCACCAPALHSTGEIGCIKVLDSMPHRGGTRITLIAGEDAWRDYQNLDFQMRALMKLFSAKRELVAEMAEDYAKKTQEMHLENTELKKEITELYAANLLAEIHNSGTASDKILCFFMKNADEVQVRNVINKCVKEYDGILAGFRGNDADGYRYVCGRAEQNISQKISLRALAKEMKEALGGSGGGSEIMIQGSAPAKEPEIRAFFANR